MVDSCVVAISMRLIALSFCGRGLSVRSSGGQCAILDSSRKRLDWWSCVVVMMTGGGGHQVCIDILIKVTPFALLIQYCTDDMLIFLLMKYVHFKDYSSCTKDTRRTASPNSRC
jgi:hypothetical protein